VGGEKRGEESRNKIHSPLSQSQYFTGESHTVKR